MKRAREDTEAPPEAAPDSVAAGVEAIKDALDKEKAKPENRAKRPNHQAFDEIVIRTVPRYKTSGLSGNEWRISADVQVKRKGRVVWDASGSNVPDALQELARDVHGFDFSTALDEVKVDDLCDQEGCAEPFTHTYSMEKRACTSCGDLKPAMTEWDKLPVLRKFCERHAQRGDCGLEDAQSNYRVVETKDGQKAGAVPTATTGAGDVSESGFGGVVFMYGSDSD